MTMIQMAKQLNEMLIQYIVLTSWLLYRLSLSVVSISLSYFVRTGRTLMIT